MIDCSTYIILDGDTVEEAYINHDGLFEQIVVNRFDFAAIADMAERGEDAYDEYQAACRQTIYDYNPDNHDGLGTVLDLFDLVTGDYVDCFKVSYGSFSDDIGAVYESMSYKREAIR